MHSPPPPPPQQQNRTHLDEQQQHFRNQKPKIDAAIKSFCSYLVATDPEHWTLSDALLISRTFSMLLNRHVTPLSSYSSSSLKRHELKAIHHQSTETSTKDTDDPDHHHQIFFIMEINAQVWNELVASKQKVTKNLGRDALRYAWDDLDLPRSAIRLHQEITTKHHDNNDVSTLEEKFQVYVDKFYHLMNPAEETHNNDPDCRLIWGDAEQELIRRAQERQNSAAIRRDECTNVAATSVSTPFIEELPMDDDEEASHS
jgi:hypothetical protein